MLGLLFVGLACMLWAIDSLFRYPLLGSGISATRIVFSEHLLLTCIFIPVLTKSFKKVWNGLVSNLFYFLIIGGLGSALATLCFTHAFKLINPSLVILLQKLQPLVAIILARIVIGEKIKKEFIGWALICFVGSFLIIYQDIFPGIASLNFSKEFFSSKHLTGYALTLIAVVGWGSSTVFGKKLSIAEFNEKEIMAGRYLIGLLTLTPLLFFQDVEFDLNVSIWSKILIMTVSTGLFSMYFYYQGLKRITARLCTLMEMSFPLFAVCINWIYLNKPLSMTQIIGGGILLLSSTVIQIKKY